MENYIPQDKRKKILFLSDDCRMHSGIATMTREIMVGTAHRYNWLHVGAAIQHPDNGKIIDLSQSVNEAAGLTDAQIKMYPYNGYGDPAFLRYLLEAEKPDAILHFTDPRYWTWLYNMSHEIRRHIPIAYYTIWDDLPYPRYNEAFYQSCDLLMAISKQTENIVNNVLPINSKPKWAVKYVPHGIHKERFFPINADANENNRAELKVFRQQLFGNKDFDFVIMHNNRNIRRKMTSDLIVAYNEFCNKLPKEKAAKCVLLLHTQPVDENGTNLLEVVRNLCPQHTVLFTNHSFDDKNMNLLYNCSDVVVNIASNEGWGLSSTEAMMAGRVIINNVTGGLQDQCRFEDENGNWINFSPEFSSNHAGHYKKCGDWAFPIFPATRSIQGSLQTPYIFDDRVALEDIVKTLQTVYDLTPAERAKRGLKGREWACSEEAQMESKQMCNNVITCMDTMFKKWKPIPAFELINTSEKEQYYTESGVVYNN